jgi:hypothetical protein
MVFLKRMEAMRESEARSTPSCCREESLCSRVLGREVGGGYRGTSLIRDRAPLLTLQGYLAHKKLRPLKTIP